MEVIISGQKLELTDSLKSYVEERISRVSKYSDRYLTAEVHLNVEKHRHHIHAKVKGNGHLVNSEAEDPESMYKAIDLCVEKLEKQFRRGKKDYSDKKASKENLKGGALA